MRRSYLILTFFMGLLIGLSSCKQKAEMVRPGGTPSADERTRYQNVLAGELDFKTLQSKVHITLESGKKPLGVNGTVKLIRNERLQISIQPLLGIEMFRAEFTNDSIIMVDRLNKRYLAESIVEYREKLPVDVRFETVQALFLNYMFVPGREDLTDRDFRLFNWRTENDGLLIGRLKDQDLFNLHFFLNPQDQLSQTRITNPKGTHTVVWEYADFGMLDSGRFPKRSNIEYSSGKTKVKAELVYSKTEINKTLNMQFSIPSSYTRMEWKDLLKGLIK